MRDIVIDGFSDEKWHEIIKGVDLTLRRGEVLGLIGESGAGKSTLGLAAMGFAQPGCRLTSGDDLVRWRRPDEGARIRNSALRGARIAYVAQSAAAAFNPAHRLIDQTVEASLRHGTAKAMKKPATTPASFMPRCICPIPTTIGERYPHQVSGGQLATRHDRDGDELAPRSDHLRRTDHRA